MTSLREIAAEFQDFVLRIKDPILRLKFQGIVRAAEHDANKALGDIYAWSWEPAYGHGRTEGYDSGYDSGYQDGYDESYAEGIAEGRDDCIEAIACIEAHDWTTFSLKLMRL